jgi:rsbT co-antagonist protein RsbR
VEYLRRNRGDLREQWALRITDARLLTVMTADEIFSEVTAVYDNYVDALETGSVETLQAYARDLSERIIPRGVETHEVLGIVLLLRDVLARALFVKYEHDGGPAHPHPRRLRAGGQPHRRDRRRELRGGARAGHPRAAGGHPRAVDPVLQVRDRLLILPIIGVVDPRRARQLTEQLLSAIQTNRARVVVIDITGVASIDLTVANHLVQTVEAARLMGASAIITGLSSEIAQTLVDLGVDLSMMRTGGRPAGRPRGGRAPARPSHRRRRAVGRSQRDVGPTRDVRRHPPPGRLPHRLHPVRPQRQRDPRPARRPVERIGRLRCRGLVVDVAALEVIDSFVARALRQIAITARCAARRP